MSDRLWEALNQPKASQGGGPQLTELGDPDFSPSTSSQGQVPGAAAQSRIFDNQRRAQNQLTQGLNFGYDINDPDWEPIRRQAETGLTEDKGSFIGSLVGWIDGPRQAINLLIQDLAGGEAGPEFRNPNFGDYWNAMWGGIENEEGFELETGLNPISGSDTLDMFGWGLADEDDHVGRFFRGVADFGLQVATDPLTYVTFGLSGLGKKVALQTGRSLQGDVVQRVLQHTKGGKMLPMTRRGKVLAAADELTPYEKMLHSNLDQITKDFEKTLQAKGVKLGGDLPPEMQEALSRYLGRDDNVWENMTELALANKVHDDVIRPLVSRDFGNIDSLAQDLLPAYAKGGARISIPFTHRTLESGIVIPGTQGLGRKLVGDPMRTLSKNLKKVGPYAKLAENVTKGVTKMDQMAPLLRALKNGDIEGWQWHIAASAIDNMHNNVAKHTISTEMNAQWNRISQLAGERGVELDVIGADILMNLEGDNVSDVLLQQLGKADLTDAQMGWRALDPELAGYVDETITYMQQTMDSYHKALGALDPEFADKYIKGYIPHALTKSSRSFVTALSGAAAVESGQGDTLMDMAAQILNGAGKGGVAEPNLGTVRYTGRGVGKVQTIVDDGVILAHKDDLADLAANSPLIDSATGAVNPNALETRYLSTPQLNAELEPIFRRLAHENGISTAGWDGKIFNENPIDTMLEYVENMTDAINAWQTVESLTASGLAFRHATELDVQQVIQNMFNNVVENTSLIQTRRFGKVRPDDPSTMPIDTLDSIAWDENTKLAERHLNGEVVDAADDIPDPVLESVFSSGDVIPASQAARQWDEIPDDQLIEVYHSTDPETAARFQNEGILAAEKDVLPEGQRRFAPGQTGPGVYVASDPNAIKHYGQKGAYDRPTAVMAIKVRKGALQVPPEAAQAQGATVPGVMGRPNVGAVIADDISAGDIKLLTEDDFARHTQYREDFRGAARRRLEAAEVTEPYEFQMAGGGLTTDPQEFVEEVAAVGVQRPIKVAIFEDGTPQILDGHHRLAAAKRAGITDLPVEFVRETGSAFDPPKHGINWGRNLKPGWWKGGRESVKIAEDVWDKNPSNYVFRSGRKATHEKIQRQGTLQGGLYGDREAAEQFKRHASEPDGDRFVYVYRKDDLSPQVRGPLERHGEIGQIDRPPGAGLRPVGYYDPVEGKSSFRLMDEELDHVDDLTTSNLGEAFQTTPWGAEVVEESSLLHGAADQSGIAGVSKSVKIQVDDSKVIHWDSLDDVADTRRVVQKVNSSHYTDWAEDVPKPDLAAHVDRDIPMHQWSDYTDAEGVSHQAFGPEDLDAEQKARAKNLAKKDKEIKAKRAADKRPDGKAPPKLTLQARHARDGAKLRFAPYEALNRQEKTNVWRAAHEWLDRAFQEGGELEGMFTDSGIQSLIDSGLDEYTAEVLHSYVATKINTLGRDAVEFISKEPAEVFETRRLFDSWAKGLNDFIAKNAAVRDADGKLIADTDKIGIAGTREVREQLAELKRAANVLGTRGYDIAADVMRNVEAYTGVQSIKDYVNPAHFNLAGPAVENLSMQTNVAEWMSLVARNMGSIYTPEGVAAAKLAASETLKWWRAMATLPRPAFHIRNLVGASWMNLAFGVGSDSMQKAGRYGLAFRKALGEASGAAGLEQAFAALPKEMQNAWRAAWDHNVLAGFATTEFSNAVTPAGARARWDWAKAWDVDNFVLTRAGGKVMESVEDFARMSLFLEYYDEAIPGSAKTAADLVNAVHFDYSNLTPTETKLKSIIPFFVWTRRNLPLQLQTAIENPRYVQRYRAMMQAMDDNLGGDDPSNLPEADHFSAYAAGTNYKVNPNSPFWARVMIDPDLPIGDLLSIPNPEPGALMEYANQTLGPHISLIGDLNGQREFGDVNAPAPFNLVLQGLAAVGVYDRTMDGDVRIPYHMRTLLETAVPFSREIADPLSGGPTDPGRQQRLGIEEDDGFVESGLKSFAGQLAGGFGVKLTTPADVRGAAFRSDAEISELIESLRLRGEAPPIMDR